MNLAVNSRSLYRLSYRGICRRAYRRRIRSRAFAHEGTRRSRKLAGHARPPAGPGARLHRDVPARVAAGDRLRAVAQSLCRRLFVDLDGFFENSHDQARSTMLCRPWPNSPTARARPEACESENGPRFQAWKLLLKSRKGPRAGFSLSGTKPQVRVSRANCGMHLHCTRSPA